MKFRVLVLLLLLTENAMALPLAGRVRITGRAAGVVIPTIVYAESLGANSPAQPGQFSMQQKNKTFTPHVLAIPVGSTVAFPNEDTIFHNVFSLSRPNGFDLGLYRNGASKNQKFTAPATYRVFCNIHPQMAAVILVLPTPYITEADASGNYRLDLPPGRYRIAAWTERAQVPATIEVTVGAANPAAGDLTVDESNFVETQHRNKFGQPYPKP
jgi:plastocyanin